MERSIQIEDVTIALDDDGEGPALLLLHGFPATRHLWSPVRRSLIDAGFRVLSPDLAGYGASVAPSGINVGMASQARWMLALLDAVGLDRVVVIAHDVGSAAAQLMVTIAPLRIRALAVLDGVFEQEWAMNAIESIQAWNPLEAHRLCPVLARRLGKNAAMREILATYSGDSGGRQLIRAAQDLDPRETADIGGKLRASGVPALVLWGQGDAYLSMEAVGRPLAKLLGAAFVELPGGHFTPLDCADEVATSLLQFVRSLPAQPRVRGD